MATTSQTVQKLYIAYFGRPADPAGAENATKLVNWAGNPSALLKDFGKSAEYTSQFSGLTAPQIVKKIYNNLFGRDSEAAGQQFWAAKIDSGEVSLADATWTILGGVTAGSGDDVAVNSKVTYAEAFTAKLLGNAAAAVAYNSTTLDLVKAEMAKIKDAATLATSNTGLDSLISSVTTGGSTAVGSTFTLTTALDTLTGTSNNDTFVSTWSFDGTTATGTLNLGDQVNGGSGTDTLNVTTANTTGGGGGTTTVAGFSTSSVEKVVVKSSGSQAANTTTFDASTTKSAAEFWSDGSGRAVIFGTASDAASAIATNAAIGLKDTTANVTASFADSIVQGTADTGNLKLAGGVGSSSAQPTVTLNGVTTANGFETINVESTGSANRLASLASGTNVIKTLNLTGSADVRIDGVNSSALKTITASAMTGSASANINASASTSTELAFTGTANGDRVVLNGATANATNTFALNGGQGTDTIAISTGLAFTQAGSATLVSTVNKATSFEVLEATHADTRTLKANDFTGIHTFKFGVTGTATDTTTVLGITGIETADKFIVAANQTGKTGNTGGAGASAASSAMTFTGADPSQTATIELNGATAGITIQGGKGGTGQAGGSGVGAVAEQAFEFGGGISTLKIVSTGAAANTIRGGDGGAGGAGNVGTSGAAGGAGTFAIDNGAAVQSVIITGDKDLTLLGGAAGSAGATVGSDAGGAGGAAKLEAFANSVSIDATGLLAKLTISGSTEADSIKVGTGDAVVYATQGKDSITLNSGNDIIHYTNVNQSLTAVTDDAAIGNAIDSILGWSSADKFNVSSITGITGGSFTSAEFVAQNVVQAAVNAVGPTTLLQAAQTAAANIGNDKIGVFQYGGNTYVLGNDGTAGTLAAADLMIKIVGEHTLTTANFVFG